MGNKTIVVELKDGKIIVIEGDKFSVEKDDIWIHKDGVNIWWFNRYTVVSIGFS